MTKFMIFRRFREMLPGLSFHRGHLSLKSVFQAQNLEPTSRYWSSEYQKFEIFWFWHFRCGRWFIEFFKIKKYLQSGSAYRASLFKLSLSFLCLKFICRISSTGLIADSPEATSLLLKYVRGLCPVVRHAYPELA